MTKRGKANNRVNIVSFHPLLSAFPSKSNLFRSDVDPKAETDTRACERLLFGMEGFFTSCFFLHAVAISEEKRASKQ